ncbi:hypothetical protein JYK17_17570 [Streptomyces sp. KC 17012]|jgi:hypothetical protein|uniref:hypothetical protein n=1 Tax=Streptomyces plumbidurans TaxID=2814589 RepID=UPI001C9DC8E3|nr:hypothetical protein [Streptomyces plumbidurans]MBY8341840.1 hypothetical protein [Streptomyces plumbidurans]
MTDRLTVDTITSDQLDALYAERDAILAELGGRDEEARERWIQKQLDETGLRSMDFRNGATMELEPARELVAYWVGAARAMLGDAENYSETPVSMEVKVAEDPERFAFTLQRVGKITPHEARQQAEQRAEQAEAAIESVRGLATRLEEFAENALKTDDRQLYAAIARDLRTQLEGLATEPRLLGCGLCYEENGEEVHPHPECPIGSITSPLRKQLADALARFGDVDQYAMADAVLAVILPTTKLLGALHQSAEQDVTRVIDLYERWVKAGPPPLGASMARWWDKRLAELHAAIDLPEQAEDPT